MGKCKNCGDNMKRVNKLLSCELTGMPQYIEMGECDCDDITGRMVSFGENPHVEELHVQKVYPPHIQRKLDQLEELESMNAALGLSDKIASVRHLIAKDIEEEAKRVAHLRNKRIESGWFM
jgi:hypothetical protein